MAPWSFQLLRLLRGIQQLAPAIRRVGLPVKVSLALQTRRTPCGSSLVDLQLFPHRRLGNAGLCRTKWIKSNSAVPIPSSFMVCTVNLLTSLAYFRSFFVLLSSIVLPLCVVFR